VKPAAKRLGLFFRDLIDYPESLIKVGRVNFEQKDFEAEYVVFDQLGPSEKISSLEDFDGDNEQMNYGTIWRAPCLIDFYADGAYSRAVNFELMMRSQKAYDLRKSYGLNVYHVSSLTDVKQLTGQQYGERIQLSLMVEYNEAIAVETLRIDTAQFEFLVNN